MPDGWIGPFLPHPTHPTTLRPAPTDRRRSQTVDQFKGPGHQRAGTTIRQSSRLTAIHRPSSRMVGKVHKNPPERPCGPQYSRLGEPITAIKGFAELIGDADHEDQEYLVERVDSNANRLVTMVEEGRLRPASLWTGQRPRKCSRRSGSVLR